MNNIEETFKLMQYILNESKDIDDLREETKNICLSYMHNPDKKALKKVREQYDYINLIKSNFNKYFTNYVSML